eukprot:CAMPEP_0177666190 /NCGR_PEP_ID=MMETSP0447-20121125/21451_1 /TAXON_ID=0 /ORGANISM="Stygamoeba regulata, Strain BSH-02190019" /LENGTH=1237 /DNA_ID=CAMNT_0019172325 /DNA_START=97 /DNA_END=3811 /DNA_ORIENTATION=-
MDVEIDFLAEGCVAGQQLLRLVSRGNAIIAELLRLSNHVPRAFLDKGPNNKYAELIFDFRYFKTAELVEHNIESDTRLQELDDEFRESHHEILKRFYLTFESVYKYASDFTRYLEELDEAVFIQLTLEMVLANTDGKQLMAEAIYLFGVMLLLTDDHLCGPLRERLLVSYMRYRGHTDHPLADDVCRLFRATGYVPPSQLPRFARFQLPLHVVEMVISRLRSDDIYNQVSAYPVPEHRSAALATQASMLFVILFFAPELLRKRAAVMREIVDKHFPDNWVINYYMGNTVDLSLVWAPYPAARAAIENTIEQSNVQYVYDRMWKRVPTLNDRLDKLLTEGVLTTEYVLERNNHLLSVVRECNVTARFLMLHTDLRNPRVLRILEAPRDPDAAAAAAAAAPKKRKSSSSSAAKRQLEAAAAAKEKRAKNHRLLMLLLKTAQFEYQLKLLYQELLDVKHEQWSEAQKQSVERMEELADYFGGERMLTRIKKNENLQKWFADIAEQIRSLDYADSTLAGRKIHQLVQALEEVEQFHQIETSLQVKAFLGDSRQYLTQMMRVANVKEHYLVMMALIGDASYAWVTVNRFTPMLHDLIKDRPSVILLLRSTFLKFSSILDLACVRILQAGSPDLFSVSEFYSGQVVAYVRRVLEIIPRSMFRILSQVIVLQTTHLQDLPTKVPKEKLRAHAQLDVRYDLAKLTNQVSVFTEGILAMETTLVGVIQVNPRQLLEDGIRKELVATIASAMDKSLIFRQPPDPDAAQKKKKGSKSDSKAAAEPPHSISVFESRLRKLATYLGGLRRSFQYIQDYVSIYGLKIWQEEVSRIINLNVEQECNSFLKKKVLESQSQFQNEAIPVPLFPRQPGDSSVNFVGRLAEELLYHTACQRAIYVDQMASWYGRDGTELVGIRTFTLLMNAMGAFGVAGLDRLFCFKTVKGLQTFVSTLTKTLNPPKPLRKLELADAKNYELMVRSAAETRHFLQSFNNMLTPTSALPRDALKVYPMALSRLAPILSLFVGPVTYIGQMQLIRRQISFLMNFTIKMDSNLLSSSLEVFNKSLVADVQAHYLNPDSKPYPDDDNPLLSELSRYLENAGISDPLTKIYITTEPIENFPALAFLFVLHTLPRFSYHAQLSTMVTRGDSSPLDWAAFVVGVITLLKQFHSMHTLQFLAQLCQYVRALINGAPQQTKAPASAKQSASSTHPFPQEVEPVLYFLEDFSKFSGLPRKTVEAHLPPFIFDHIQL